MSLKDMEGERRERTGKRVSSSSSFFLGMENGLLLMAIGLIVFLSNGMCGMSTGIESSMEIDRRLKLLNKPAVKSIQSEDGDIIDCVDVHKQPAFDHPALKNHVIRVSLCHGSIVSLPYNFETVISFPTSLFGEKMSMAPSEVHGGAFPRVKKESGRSGGWEVRQIWQRSGSCPEGTILIRRIQKKDLLRAASLGGFGRKPPARPLRAVGPNGTEIPFGPETHRSMAMMVSYGYDFFGVSGAINVWKPTVESPDEYSTGQVWFKSGDMEGYDSAESGWVVYPALYGDDKPRSFIHWTSDSYRTTGCFDLTCAGFVQTSSNISFGTAVEAVSTANGPQYEIDVGIYLDPITSNVWLDYGKEKRVGYWPGSLFQILNFSGTVAGWGGEVYSPRANGSSPHTNTQMGSGSFPTALFGIASYVSGLRDMDFSLQWKFPKDKEPFVAEFQCYNAFLAQSGPGVEPKLFFGGPGQNARCQ